MKMAFRMGKRRVGKWETPEQMEWTGRWEQGTGLHQLNYFKDTSQSSGAETRRKAKGPSLQSQEGQGTHT